ncbi:MAG: hypothetical protein HKO03_09550 [Acidimicrobiia bacterium]|nr:hypothetical protein [Acidimicrobiia bacterium]
MKFFERIEAQWDEFTNEARIKWDRLKETDWDDIEREVEGRWRRFTEKVDSYYHKSADEVEREAEEVMSDIDSTFDSDDDLGADDDLDSYDDYVADADVGSDH